MCKHRLRAQHSLEHVMGDAGSIAHSDGIRNTPLSRVMEWQPATLRLRSFDSSESRPGDRSYRSGWGTVGASSVGNDVGFPGAQPNLHGVAGRNGTGGRCPPYKLP